VLFVAASCWEGKATGTYACGGTAILETIRQLQVQERAAIEQAKRPFGDIT